MGYEVFDPKKYSSRGTAGVTIRKSSIAFNRNATNKYFEKAAFAELYFDQDKNRIGIKPLKAATENAIEVKGKKSKYISAKSFLELYRCSHPEAKKYQPVWSESTQIIEIQL